MSQGDCWLFLQDNPRPQLHVSERHCSSLYKITDTTGETNIYVGIFKWWKKSAQLKAAELYPWPWTVSIHTALWAVLSIRRSCTALPSIGKRAGLTLASSWTWKSWSSFRRLEWEGAFTQWGHQRNNDQNS
jgi:hypothetical protein